MRSLLTKSIAAVIAVAAIGPAAISAADTSDPVQAALASLNTGEKAGQLIMRGIAGTRLTDAEKRSLSDGHIGGVILFARNIRDDEQVLRLTRSIQRHARRGNPAGVGALIAVDQEGGPVKRFTRKAPWKSHPRIGALDDRAVAWRQGKMTGVALAEVGVNMNLAPVLDLNIGPTHVMASRSFGSRPGRVAELGSTFSLGLQRAGVVATVKHFPGLGGATRNTDDGRAVVDRSREQLTRDLRPFQRAIDDGALAVMASHAIYPALKRRPASLTRSIMDGLLRQEMGFTGVTISDSLPAVGWFTGGDLRSVCVKTIKAGVDIALGVAGGCRVAIRDAVRAGDLRPSRLDQATERVLEVKHWLGLIPEPA